MKDEDKTKEQLIEELAEMRQQIAELEAPESERKRAEEALRESREKYREMINGMNDTVWVIGFDGKFIDVNETAVKALGYSREELLSMGPVDIDSHLAKEQIEDLIRRMPSDEIQVFETEHTAKEGKTIPVEISSSLVTYQGRRAILSIARDITERKRAEEALRDSRHMLQTVLDSIPAAVFWKDRDSIYLGGNRTFLEAAGLKSPEEIVGNSDYDLPWEKRQADSFREDDRRVMESSIPEYGIIEPYLRADSTHAWARTNKVPLRDTEGNVVGVLGTYEDITERKRAEEALRRSERRLKEAQAMGRIGDWKYDIDNQKITWSDQVFKLYERDPGLGAPTPEEEATCYSPEQIRILREYARRSIETGQEFEYDLEVKLPSGKTGYFSACMHPIKDESGRVVELFGTVQDITDRKRAEEALRKSEQEKSLILSSLSELVAHQDRKLRIIWANRAAAESVGSSPEQLVGCHCYEIWHGRGEPCVACPVAKAIETGQPQEAEMTTPDGRVWFLRGYPVREANGDITGAVEVTLEITERKRAEEAVELRMEQLAALSSASQAVTSSLELKQVLAEVVSLASKVVASDYTSVVLVDEAGHMGQSAENLSGVPAIEYRVREEGFTSWLVRSRQPVVVDEIGENGAVSPDRGEGALHTANPHLVEIGVKSLVGLPLVAKDRLLGVLYLHSLLPHAFQGQLPLLTAFANQAAIAIENARLYQEAQRELTERKRAEEALRESEEKYRTLVEQSLEGIVIAQGPLPCLVFANPAMAKILGYTIDELTSLSPRETEGLIHSEDRALFFQRFRDRLAGKSAPPRYEIRGVQKDGTVRWLEISASRIEYQGQPAVQVAFVDITERKRAEEEVLRHLERVEALREIDRAITSTLDLPRVLDIILQELERVIPYHSAGIFLFSNGIARLAAGRGFPDLECVLQVSFLVEEDPLTCELVQKKRPLVLADAQTDERFLARGDTEYVRSWIGVPLIAKGTAVGFLSVDHRETGVYDEESAELAQTFASQAAIAIENASLYQEAQRELAERKRAEQEVRQSYVKLRTVFRGTVNTLVSAIEMRDPYTAGHQQRTTQLACAIANKMGLIEGQIEGLRMAGLIHDLGKINVPADILSKPGRLSEIEFGLIKMHPQIGHKVLSGAIEFPWPVAQIVLQHHERMDGSGYPQGLSGDEILLEARILSVADVVEAMVSHRPYRAAHSIEDALEEISQNRGVLYDPEVVDACLKLFTKNGFEFE